MTGGATITWLTRMPSYTVSKAEAAGSTQVISFGDMPTDRSPEEYQGSFFYGSSEEMLGALSVRVYPEDKVFAFPEPALGLGSRLSVYRAQPVLIKDGSAERLVRTWSSTVEEVLKEQGVELDGKDKIYPGRDASIAIGESPAVVTITRVAESEVVVKESISFKTEYVDDATLEKGVEKVESAGSNGVLQKTYSVRRENGVEISRRLIGNATTKEAVSKVIRRGTKVVDLGSGGASWYGGVPALTAAHRTLPFGTKVKVVNVANGKSVVVTIADRGPFIAGRVIDLSSDAFAQISTLGTGVATVRLEKAQ
ncbi:MAG: hypothetical protein K0S20_129 [Patescibacteria group bacterium]|nr:hypothetical protein [Patescibacteria group bacterium]